MEDWMKLLTCATYEYTRRMVAELQGQLDALNAAETTTDRSSTSIPHRISSTSKKSKPSTECTASSGTKPLIDFEVGMVRYTRGGSPIEANNVGGGGRGAMCTGGTSDARSFENMHEDFGNYIADSVPGGAKTLFSH